MKGTEEDVNLSTLCTYVRIVLFGRAMASHRRTAIKICCQLWEGREPKTAKCAEMAGLITWQAAIVFLECFLLPPQLDANYIIMMINVSTTLSSDWKSDQSKVFWSLSLGISIPVCIKCPRKLFPWRESSAGWVQITRLSFSWLTQ